MPPMEPILRVALPSRWGVGLGAFPCPKRGVVPLTVCAFSRLNVHVDKDGTIKNVKFG